MLEIIRSILDAEAEAVRNIPADNPFAECVALFLEAKRVGAKVVISGVGKAGEIGKKIATTFCSVGVPSVYLHPLEAQHGDLGVIHANDVLLLISNSGKTREVVELHALAHHLHPSLKTIVLTGNLDTALTRQALHVLWNGNPKEVCPMGLTPTSSTTTMAVIGDVLAVLIVKCSNYGPSEYSLRHHSGYLGEKSKQAAATMFRANGTKAELRAIYELLHRENPDYQTNNWLLEDVPFIASLGAASILELGTGNGRFARAIAAHAKRVIALDWVESPICRTPALPTQVDLRIQDALTAELPTVDLTVSADFLEHLPTEDIPGFLARFSASSPRQFHTIACYPDSRGLHLTTQKPDWWLEAFQRVDRSYRIARQHCRRQRNDQVVVTVTRGVPAIG